MINNNYMNTNNEVKINQIIIYIKLFQIEEEEPRPLVTKEKNSFQGFSKNII